MDNLEDLINEIKAQHTYSVYKRSVPIAQPTTLNKVIVQNLPSYEAGIEFLKTMKLEAKVENLEDGSSRVIFYDVLPDTPQYKNVFYNDSKITKVGNDKKKVARNYMDLED